RLQCPGASHFREAHGAASHEASCGLCEKCEFGFGATGRKQSEGRFRASGRIRTRTGFQPVRTHPAFDLLEEPGAKRRRRAAWGFCRGHSKGFLGAIQKDFGGFQLFRNQLNEVASSIMESGWAALVWEPIGKRLLITQIYDHQSNLAQAGVPLLVIDAWAHVYYIQHQNRKTEFFEIVWHLWNWEDVSARYASALQLNLDIGKAT